MEKTNLEYDFRKSKFGFWFNFSHDYSCFSFERVQAQVCQGVMSLCHDDRKKGKRGFLVVVVVVVVLSSAAVTLENRMRTSSPFFPG